MALLSATTRGSRETFYDGWDWLSRAALIRSALVSDALADHPGERPDQLSILSMPS
ncbi:MAG TPA: hypothetical protein VJW75_08380 [Candidatus Eisenbacteria bacterium]|nr:hypothetical protein [Candidatus Eisenbacteria bacterium]